MDKILVIKIGGNVIDDEKALSVFLQDISSTEGKKILVHGGGKLATRLAQQMEVPQQMVEGRRITDAETLKIVTMVYAGYINKAIVSQLQGYNCNAIGLTGADGNLIQSHKRTNVNIDYGFVGDIDNVNADLLVTLLHALDIVVVAPITHDKKGQLLNTNADTIAQEIAKALSKKAPVDLIYCFEKKGVLLDATNDDSVIPSIDKKKFEELKEQKLVFDGMIPKLTNAFAAIDSGVSKVIIGNASELKQIITGHAGTTIVHGNS
ncbi:MAG TPA: acetylglutamate kinase [Flavipsychrobacter sp.]|nr:acetylglutamate kinase [Flavipsychrobacter sp.]